MSAATLIFNRVFFWGTKIDPEGKSTLDHPETRKYKPESLKPASPGEPVDPRDGFTIDFGDDTYVGDFPAGFGEKSKDIA